MSQPLYKQVKNEIVASLVRNEWPPGEMLPSEKQLAARFSVAVSTVRAAIGELADAGVVVRTQGKGTCVAHHNARGNVYRFFNVVRNGGEKEAFHRELLSLRKERADARAIAQLHLPAQSAPPQVYRLRIKLSAAFPAFAYAEIVLPCHLFSGLAAKGIPDGASSLYSFYQSTFGVNIVRVEEALYAVRAGPLVSKVLELPASEPLLRIERVAFALASTPVELRTTWVHTRHYHYYTAQGSSD